LGARLHGLVSPHVELRDVAVTGGMVLTSHDRFPRLAVALGVGGQVQVLGSPLTSSNIGYISGQNGMIARLEAGSRWCNVSFDWGLIRQVAETHGYHLTEGDHTCGMPIATHNGLKALLSRTARGLQHVDLTDTELEDVLARSVLRLLSGSGSEKKLRRANQCRAVHRAVDYIRSEYANPVTVTQLCRVAGIGERSLENLFRDATGFTMQQYLMNHRLLQARAMLLHGRYDTIRDVAEACGIPHSGRFSQYYRQMFGQSPRETLAGS